MAMKVSPYPIPELREFLLPFRSFFYRYESFQTLERLATGLLAEIERKSGAGVAAAVANLSDGAIYRLLGETSWDAVGFNCRRVQRMVESAVAGDGVLVVDET
jgi:SRSO17 transposase